MHDNKIQLSTIHAWPFIELPGFRQHPDSQTYTNWKSVPPIPADRTKDGCLWLLDLPPSSLVHSGIDWVSEKAARWESFLPSHLKSLRSQAAELNLTIPADFLAFYDNPNILTRLPSSTGVFFKIPSRFIEVEPEASDRLLCFAHDYQGCLYWFLYIKPEGCCIVATHHYFGGMHEFDSSHDFEDEDDESELVLPTVEYCCVVEQTFSAFIYRYWMENQIWFACNGNRELSAEQFEYASYYKSQPKPHYLTD